MVRESVFPPFKFAVWTIPATTLIIIPALSDPINLPKLLALIALAVTSLTLLLALKKFRKKRNMTVRLKVVTALYGTLAISMIVTGLASSENQIRVLFGTTGRNNGLLYYVSAILVALALTRILISQSELSYLNRVILWTSIPFGIYSGLQFLYLDPIGWNNPYNRVIGTLGNPNFSSSLLAIFSVYWLFVAFQTTKVERSKKIAILTVSFTFGFLSWSTASVQGLVVMALGIGLVTFVFLRERYASKVIPSIFIFGGGSLLSVLFISFAGFGPLGSVLEQYTLRLRGWYASFGIRAMLDHPLTGVGVDNYISAFRTYRTQEFVSQYGVSLSTNNAHSTPAHLGATFGLVVFVLYCALQLLILYRAISIINSRDKGLGLLKGISIFWILAFSQSLLSIEIIGLGVINWVLGAILLCADVKLVETDNSGAISKSKREFRDLPAWVGSISIVSLLVGFSPAIVLSGEDQAFKRLVSAQIQGSENAEWVKGELAKLSGFTFSQPEKVTLFIVNLYRAGLYVEAEDVLKRMYKENPKDVYANDLLASYYGNVNQLDAELEIREKLRSLDPMNFQLELTLAQIYAKKRDLPKLESSAVRITQIAPQSAEAMEVKKLIDELRSNQ